MTAAELGPAVRAPDGTGLHSGIAYGVLPGYRPLLLDLHLPPGKGPHPVVVFVHGGGWLVGSRDAAGPAYAGWRPSLLARVAAAGVAVVSVDYRLSGEARWPAALEDVVLALRWVRTEGTALGLDPDRVATWGESAGGQLAAVAGLLAGDPRGGGPVRTVVAWYAPSDLRTLAGQLGADPDDPGSREAQVLGGPVSTAGALADDASAVTHVHRGAPPFLLLHGRADTLVPAAQSIDLEAALRRAGVGVELELLDGADHLWRGSGPAAAHAAERTIAHLRHHLLDR